MEVDEVVVLFERLLRESDSAINLSDIQEIVLRQSVSGKSYQKIAENTGYDHDYIKQTGAKLWRSLSVVLNKPVNKGNLRSVVKQYWQEERSANTAQDSVQDWGDAVDVTSFLGRESELKYCQNWIVDEGCRLITILGMGGIGKTALTSKLAREIAGDFEYVIWRSLRNAPPFVELIADCILLVSRQQEINIPFTVDASIACLMKYLAASRCLLILDNVESILLSGSTGGRYRPGYEGYGQLFRCLADEQHQSCLIITSREAPMSIGQREGQFVRSLQVSGLAIAVAQEILKMKGVADSERLIEQYTGNPLALKIASTTIKSIFAGDVAEFLGAGSIVFGNIWDLLEQQFNRLSKLEQAIMYWLAINREGLTLSKLKQDLIPVIAMRQLLESLESLKGRSLIEVTTAGFTQQPVVMEYVTEKLINILQTEISTGEINLLQTHPMIKVKDKDYLQQTQVRLILEPIAASLVTEFEDKFAIEQQLNNLLTNLRITKLSQSGYAIGNLINLLKYFDIDLRGYDFSGFKVWQADLRALNLPGVNFTDADLSKSIFAEKMGSIFAVDFSSDGKLLATGGDQGIKIWQVPEYKLVKTLGSHDSPPIWTLAFSPDGLTLASGSSDRLVRLWDVETGDSLQIFAGHQGSIGSLAFSSDGQTLASSSEDNSIKLWQLETATELATFPSVNSLLVDTFALSPDGNFLATNNKGDGVKIWQLNPKTCLQTIDIDNCPDVLIAFSPNSQLLGIGLPEGTIKLWDMTQKTWQLSLEGHATQLTDLCFSSDGRTLVSCSVDATIRHWKVAEGQCIRVLRGHQSRVSSISINADNQTLASGSEDGSVRIWDLITGQCLKKISGYSDRLWSIASSPDGKTLASANETGVVRLWHIQTGDYHELAHWGRVKSVAFSPDGKTLASVTYNYQIKLWNLANNQCIQTIDGLDNWCWSIAFSSNSKTIVTSGGDSCVRCWDVATGNLLKVLAGHQGITLDTVFLSANILATTSADQTVKLWDLDQAQCLKTFAHDSVVWSIACHPASNKIVTGCEDGTVKLWQKDTDKCLATLVGHNQIVISLAFNHDGSLIASGASDRTIRIWDVATSECLKTIDAHQDSVFGVAFIPTSNLFNKPENREILASGSHDETVKLWDVATGECLQVFKAPSLYQGMNIKGATGLTRAQKEVLKALGSVD